MQNMTLLKLILLMSALLGIILGVAVLIPFVGGFAFFVLLCFVSPLVLGLLLKSDVLRLDNIAESAVLGGIVGFVSYITFSIFFMPVTMILSKVFNYNVNYGVTLALGNANLFIIIVVSIFMGILSATLNAFSGFLTYYVSEILKNMNSK